MIRVSEVEGRLRGKTDPAVIRMMEALVVEQHTIHQQLIECIRLLSAVSQVSNEVLQAAQSQAVFNAQHIEEAIRNVDAKYKLTHVESAMSDLGE